MLNSPATAKRMRKLRDEGVIIEEQMQAWKTVRPKLTHGNVMKNRRINRGYSPLLWLG